MREFLSNVTCISWEQPLNDDTSIVATLAGMAMLHKLEQPLNALASRAVNPLKCFNSLKNSMSVLFWNTVPIVVTAATSSCDNSPSPFVSHNPTHRFFTSLSANIMMLEL